MYDPTFFHRVSMAIHEDNLRQAAARYRVQEDRAAQPARPYPQFSVRRLGQVLPRNQRKPSVADPETVIAVNPAVKHRPNRRSYHARAVSISLTGATPRT